MDRISIKILILFFSLVLSLFVECKEKNDVLSFVDNKEITFSQLGINQSITLAGNASTAYLSFGSRLDEIVSKASLEFSFMPSPSLVASVSHMKVYLNDELMGVIVISDDKLGEKVNASLPLDSRFISNFNQLKFELIASNNSVNRQRDDSSIWVDISKSGRVSLQVQKSILATDLSLFPVPFFDERDFSHVSIPFVFPVEQDVAELTAAGVMASYFGAMANWRGVSFPVYIDKLPNQHAIVFATNEHKPAFIHDLPNVSGPMLQLITHPTNEYAKLLLVLGRDASDLTMAVQGLILGKSLLTGPIARVNSVTDLKPRKPYDAPNWVSTSRPVTFAELVDGPYQLETEGRTSSPISVSFNLPPDLFAWQSRGIPVKLSYRYSPMHNESGARMSFLVNGQFVEAFNLSEKGRSTEDTGIRIPLMDDLSIDNNTVSHIPGFRIDSENTMKFEFSFSSSINATNYSARQSHHYAVMDADSTLDFSGFSHYIKMPNLRAFASSGYPFSRMADLSETVVVMNDTPSLPEISLMLDTLGLIGSKTGYPAFKVMMLNNLLPESLNDKDILTIGSLLSSNTDVSFPDGAKLILNETSRQLALPVNNNKLGWATWFKSLEEDSDITGVVDVTSSGPFASMVAMESPYSSNRSLISLVASTEKDLSLIAEALNDSGKVAHMFGSVVTIQSGQVASFDVGNTFYAGQLPVVDLILFHFSFHPALLALCVLVIAFLLSVVLLRTLRQISARRLAAGGEK
ncbi:cellulose biosynthesis cyclic di-GMP-binding regulatory protein BcsB [uncultured Photobacterium sp.]|uniref:cellulose biosynthesis cyclic di-GMP-binding regulatory protein BcsB n=1 Tax=uncultured Photobacterium sp. TaxID=173973 RepID=UPI00260A641E|nr:cellulose biosynthesis cyclic di-GMP-binding regulatory protein BcsB [uncultured Photobacterium sp.]